MRSVSDARFNGDLETRCKKPFCFVVCTRVCVLRVCVHVAEKEWGMFVCTCVCLCVFVFQHEMGPPSV